MISELQQELDTDKGYCVYLFRRKDTGDVVYVGEGRKERALWKRSKDGRNKKLKDIAKKTELVVEIVEWGLTKEQAENLEQDEIQKYKDTTTNVNVKANTPREYRREDWENIFYIDSTSPSGLRYKNEWRGKKVGDIVGVKHPTGYWKHINHATHRIVYALAHGVCPKNFTIDHVDCNKDNNSVENLVLMTRSKNSRKGNPYKRKPKIGEDNGTSKITNSQIIEIYKRFEDGASNREIGSEFGLHDRYVSLIRHGKRWKSAYQQYGKTFPPSFTENKITVDQVKQALRLLEDGLTNKEISLIAGIERSSVSRLRNGKAFHLILEQIKKGNQ
mgnify:CR=1 FL=1